MSLFASSRQLQAAASHDSIDDLLAAEQPRVQLTSGYSEGYQEQLDRLAADFHDFFLDMSEQPNGLDSLHPQHRSLADVFCPGSPSLSYQSAALFIKHWASTSGSRLGRPLHVNTALRKVFVLAQHTRHTTDNPFDPTTFSHMTVATEARVGTCLKGKHKYKKQKRLVWGDITLVVTKSKLTGGVNQLSHFFESPNAKRRKIWTAELDWFPVLWLDATFYLLIIAHIAGALSDGWTYDQLLDPRQFDSRPGDCFELSFNPAKSTEAVFLGTGNENEWTTGAVGAHLDQITAHAGLQGRVTPHSLRRSGAVAMKLKNATHEQIQQQLNHAVGTATFLRYSGFIVTADASAAVYETASRVEDTHQHHPERVKVLPRLPDVLPALSISARQNLLSGQKMTNALPSSHALDEELRSNDVESYTALPPKAKSRLGVIYKRAQRLYRRLYRRKLTEVNSHVGPTNISNDDNDDDDDDDDADDEQGSGDAAVESSVNGVAETEPPLDRIDDFPEAEEAGGDAIQAAHFLERTDLENPSTTYRLMREARQRSNPTPAESSHHALESNTVRSEAVRTINLPADWAIDPELESLAVETVNPFVPPATENDSHRPGDPTGVAHQDPAMTNDFTPLFKVVEALFANREGNRGEAYALCMALPLDDTLLFGYRPGHAPVNNCCNFCDQPIPSVVSFPKNRPNDNVTMKRHIATHVNKGRHPYLCPGRKEIREVMDRVKHVRDGCESSAQVHALYRDQTKSQQDQVMADTPLSPLRPRKIIVATNIAETSLTFPFLNIVIDTGLVKVNSYDPTHGVEWLLLKSVSKAQADQRAGRVGRTRPGFVFRLYTLNSYVRFDQYPAPAITRESFDSSLLAWLAMGHRDVARDALPALPSRQHRLRAVDNLRLLGALKPSFELTVHGEQMSRLPVKPMIAKMILESRKFGTQLTAINLAAVLSAEKILDKIRNLDRDIGALHARFRDPQGDHFTLLNVFQAYESTRLDRQWSQVNFINTQGCEEALAMRDTIKQLIQVMYPEWQMKLREPDSPDYIEKIGKTLLAGFFPNLVSIQRTRGTYQTVRDGSGDSLHPDRFTSVSHRPEYIIFTKLRPHPFKHQTLMSEVSAVDHAWIKEVVPAVSGVSSHDYKLKR